MKFFYFFILLSLFAKQSAAQQNHFIYIQTENKQPFYVKMADRLLSSSSVGYLVIAKLQNGKYEIGIGFPKNEWPLQKMTVTVKNNDAGYVLKNFESKGWGLFNMQTMEIVMSSGTVTLRDSTKEIGSDGFADVLADVVSTPSIKEKPAVKEIKQEKDTPVAKTVPVEAVKSSIVTRVEPIKPAVKIFSSIDADGRSIVYVDTYENKADTIRVLIPYKTLAENKETTEKPVPTVETVKKEEPKKETKPETKQETKQENKQDGKFIDMELPNPNKKTDSVVLEKKAIISNEATIDKKEPVPANKDITEPKAEPKAMIMVNSDCRTTASEEDFLKLRKKMAAEKSDDEMIVVAKKAFRSKCYSTEQVGNLSALFLKDDGRYNFFDAAYPRVSDSQNFGRLVTKLTDEYYITRFNAMIRH
ncbi:MAG: DUF4476 domain-containing protein [Ferruginibacter sp.]